MEAWTHDLLHSRPLPNQANCGRWWWPYMTHLCIPNGGFTVHSLLHRHQFDIGTNLMIMIKIHIIDITTPYLCLVIWGIYVYVMHIPTFSSYIGSTSNSDPSSSVSAVSILSKSHTWKKSVNMFWTTIYENDVLCAVAWGMEELFNTSIFNLVFCKCYFSWSSFTHLNKSIHTNTH